MNWGTEKSFFGILKKFFFNLKNVLIPTRLHSSNEKCVLPDTVYQTGLI